MPEKNITTNFKLRSANEYTNIINLRLRSSLCWEKPNDINRRLIRHSVKINQRITLNLCLISDHFNPSISEESGEFFGETPLFISEEFNI